MRQRVQARWRYATPRNTERFNLDTVNAEVDAGVGRCRRRLWLKHLDGVELGAHLGCPGFRGLVWCRPVVVRVVVRTGGYRRLVVRAVGLAAPLLLLVEAVAAMY